MKLHNHYGGKGGHSVFTGRLIEALAGVKDFITAKQLGIEKTETAFGGTKGKSA
ncbi:hypothetical protein GMMP15_2120002 [Candidatus Magnetomoraceae bacterium gMMP-15]